MTTTSTSTSNSTTGLSTTSIDVASIVSQLMTIENKPLDALKAQTTTENVVISDLGSIKSKVSAFQDALKTFQNPNSYNSLNAAISDATVASVVVGTNAVIGNYQVTVKDIARAAHYVGNGYSAATDVFNSSGSVALTDINGTLHTLSGSSTVQGIVDWINANSASFGLTASIKQVDATHVALWIDGAKMGKGNDFTITADNKNLTVADPVISKATSANLLYNSTDFFSDTNTITNAIDGVTFTLTKASLSPQIVSVTHAADNSQTTINALISSYNDLMKSYSALTANANNSTTPGTFGSNPTMLSFINEIKSKFAEGGTYTVAGTQSTISLSELGVDLQSDGTLKFNPNNYALAKSKGRDIPTILSSGFQIGYVSSSDNLKSYLDGLVGLVVGAGSLDQVIQVETTRLQQLNTKQGNIQDHLITVQNNLTAQYSALNALLFQLSSTSSALTSALYAIANPTK
jgi:flagellar hook-associated protein 2